MLRSCRSRFPLFQPEGQQLCSAMPPPFPISDPTTGRRPKNNYGYWVNTDHSWCPTKAAEQQQCRICSNSCPAYRQITTHSPHQARKTVLLHACCASRHCGASLCHAHMLPNDKGSSDRRHRFCPACVVHTPHCTSCGIPGTDQAYNANRETAGHANHRFKPITLWPCGRGCYNLLCQRCGTQQDGCTLHRRKEPCGPWYQHWGLRSFEGLCERQASTLTLSPAQMARYQTALADDSCGPKPLPPLSQPSPTLRPTLPVPPKPRNVPTLRPNSPSATPRPPPASRVTFPMPSRYSSPRSS